MKRRPCLGLPLANCCEDLEPIATGKPEIQKNEVERLGGRPQERAVTRLFYNDVVLFRLQPVSQGIGNFRFVFYNEDAHAGIAVYRSNSPTRLKNL